NVSKLPHSATPSKAQINTGGRSTTVIVWLHMEMFVQESKARQVRVAVKAFVQPALGRLVTVLTTSIVTFVPSQMSLAKGRVKLKGVPHSTVWLSAQVRVGGVVSTSVTV